MKFAIPHLDCLYLIGLLLLLAPLWSAITVVRYCKFRQRALAKAWGCWDAIPVHQRIAQLDYCDDTRSISHQYHHVSTLEDIQYEGGKTETGEVARVTRLYIIYSIYSDITIQNLSKLSKDSTLY